MSVSLFCKGISSTTTTASLPLNSGYHISCAAASLLLPLRKKQKHRGLRVTPPSAWSIVYTDVLIGMIIKAATFFNDIVQTFYKIADNYRTGAAVVNGCDQGKHLPNECRAGAGSKKEPSMSFLIARSHRAKIQWALSSIWT